MDFRFEDGPSDGAYDVWHELAFEPMSAVRPSKPLAKSKTALDADLPAYVAAPKLESVRTPRRRDRLSRALLHVAIAPIPSLAILSMLVKAVRGV